MVAIQGSLLGLGSEVQIGALESGLERLELGDGAWLDVRRGWIEGGDVVFSRLADAVPWRAERRPMYDRVVDVPRLLAFYDAGEPLPDGVLLEMREALRGHYRGTPGDDVSTAGLCLYRDGHDSVAWHGDRFGRGNSADVLVAITSFGATRPFLVRPRGGGRSLRLVLDSGDLLVMGGSCQRTFDHCVPKTTRPVGGRISVQFRSAGVR
ncbi:MAG TPA: alpha-ketoglutarate-dependent dioxygenase AlkB [Acidimicrobiales bacterium]|nr:alpha-ketoglutarate-dependent dioxygenase AlkB [Acidimicrobiales bacterium]